MSFIGLDLTKNISLFTIPAAFAVGLSAQTYAILGAAKSYDNANPRGFRDNIAKSETIDKVTKQRLSRAKAASENMFETIGLYAAAVVAANMAGVPTSDLNFWTLTYVASRVAYNFWYIWVSSNRQLAGGRSFIWMYGIISIVTLFTKAGFRLMNQ